MKLRMAITVIAGLALGVYLANRKIESVLGDLLS
jgi:uncharacterized protein YneF (UPF0154 family)